MRQGIFFAINDAFSVKYEHCVEGSALAEGFAGCGDRLKLWAVWRKNISLKFLLDHCNYG
jgi:hypothetical protein